MSSESRSGVSRRGFNKQIVVGAALAAVALPGLAMAGNAGISNEIPVYPGGEEGFGFVTETPFPKLMPEVRIIFGKKTAKIYKDHRSLSRDKFIEVNGIAAAIVQLCDGGDHFDKMVEVVGFFYKVDPQSIRVNTRAFLQYLFEEGFICFVSEKSWGVKKRGGGLTLLEDAETTIKIVSQPQSNKPISF